jgi:hypothetical protein
MRWIRVISKNISFFQSVINIYQKNRRNHAISVYVAMENISAFSEKRAKRNIYIAQYKRRSGSVIDFFGENKSRENTGRLIFSFVKNKGEK